MPACHNHPDIIDGVTACSRCGAAYCANCLISLQGKPVCAGCKGEQVRDIASGVNDQADWAGRGARFAGAFVDSIIIMIPAWMVTFAIMGAFGIGAKAPGTLYGISDVISQLLILSLAVVYEAQLLKRRAQTLGKMAAKIAVVSDDGQPLTPRQCWTRALSRGLLALTQIGGVIDILMIFSKDRRTLHDRIAKTHVVNWKR